MTRRLVRCTACPWTGRRSTTGAPCPKCGSAIVFAGDARGPGRPSTGDRVRLTCRPLAATIAALGDHPSSRAAEILDEHEARTATTRRG